MPRMDFVSTINRYVAEEWRGAVQAGEERYARGEVGSPQQIRRIKQHACWTLVRGLVDLKGKCLNAEELEYTLELFETVSGSVDYLALAPLEPQGFPREMREFMVMERVG